MRRDLAGFPQPDGWDRVIPVHPSARAWPSQYNYEVPVFVALDLYR